MRILITNNHLVRLGGTETWVITMAEELSRRHDVCVFTHEKGYVSGLLKDFVVDDPPRCDLALINHSTCAHVRADVKVFTSHGIVPGLETPLEGADAYVGVSEEIADRYDMERVIRNPVDTLRFQPRTEIAASPRKALAIVSEPALRVIRRACEPLGIDVLTPTRYDYETPDLINRVDLVFSLGRGALEAMSCGRPVILYDERGYTSGGDGYFDDPAVRACNYSGRCFKRPFGVESLTEEILKYKKSDGERNRAYVLEHHDVRRICEAYLEIHREFSGGRGHRRRSEREATGLAMRDAGAGGARPASIILTGCRDGRLLEKAVESALNQTHPRTEVIVVEEGPAGRIRQVLDRYRDRIIPVRSEGEGQASAFNAGFRASSGAAVLFLDSHDLLSPPAVEKAFKFLSDPRAVVVHWPLWTVDERGVRTGEVHPKGVPGGALLETVIRTGPLGFGRMPGAAAAWRRDFLQRVLPVPEADYKDDAIAYLLELSPLFGLAKKTWEPQGYHRVWGRDEAPSRGRFDDALPRKAASYSRHCDLLGRFCKALGLGGDPERWKRDSWWNQLRLANEETLALVPPGDAFVLVDEERFEDGFAPGRRALPFTERDGAYWGPPPDDAAAISELDRMRRAGARFVVFGWPAFWWLDHYAGLRDHLHSTYPCALKNSRLVAFDLRP